MIYLAAPFVIRETDRYGRFVSLISRKFPDAELIEAKDLFPVYGCDWERRWQTILERFDTLVVLCNEQHEVGRGTWKEVDTAHQAGKNVYMAHQKLDETLGLVPYDQLDIRLNRRNQRNYATVKRKKEASVGDVAASPGGGKTRPGG